MSSTTMTLVNRSRQHFGTDAVDTDGHAVDGTKVLQKIGTGAQRKRVKTKNATDATAAIP